MSFASRLCLLAPLWLTACGTQGDTKKDPPKPSASPAASAAAEPAQSGAGRPLIDLVKVLPSCDIDHRGELLDTGTDAMVGRYGWARSGPRGLTHVEHDGSTWARLLDRRLQVSFSLLAPTSVFVAARAVGYAAKSASVLLDDQPLGTLTFAREQIRIARTGATTLPVDPGLHTLTFRFLGRARDGDALADIDWLRIGVPDDLTATYAPPTLRDTVAPAVALGGVPHRSIALHAKGTVRCPLRFARGVHLRTAVGIEGGAEGEAEIRVVRDGKKPEILRIIQLGGEKAGWVDVDLPLDSTMGEAHAPPLKAGSATAGTATPPLRAEPSAMSVGAIELSATRAPEGARVLFGDPVIVVSPGGAPLPPPARAVVVVILDGVERSELPPWSTATTTLPALTDLAQNAAVFERHRAPTTVVAASVASLVTGLPPMAHGLIDRSARLPPSATTVATIARDANVRSAMFTGVPQTFRAFGFATGWERFVEYPPSSGAPATAPIDEAAAWITELTKGSGDARVLMIIHARGGHPPWDVTPKELADAAPRDYAGLIEPRRASQTLAKMRRAKRAKIVTDADRQRVHALETIALIGQDRAIGALISSLKAAGLWDATLFVVTSDVGTGASSLFGENPELSESALTLPLYVHFPGNAAAGRRVAEPSEVVDVTTTILRALGVAAPKDATTRDLAKLALDIDLAAEAPLIATLDNRYSGRWGDLVLTGRYPQPPSLCDLALDATCAFNRRDAMPIAVNAIFRRVVAQDVAMQAVAAKREPASIDEDTAAALRVWGASE